MQTPSITVDAPEQVAPAHRDPVGRIRIALAGLLAFLALNAFAGGYYGMSGAHGVPGEWLEGSPFSDYFVPGLILFAIIGGSSAVATIAVFLRWRSARSLAIGAGVIVLVWLATQLAIIGYVSWMQPTTALAAVGILALAASLRTHAPARGAPTAVAMQKVEDAATVFLGHKRIAVTGVSRHAGNHGANYVYQRLRERGYRVFAINPNATQVEGDPAFSDLRSIPDGVDAVVIATSPEHAESTMRDCVELGVRYVWMHRSIGKGSVSDAATAYGRRHGVHVIDGGCPLMFDPVTDPAHKMMRFFFTLTGKVPRRCA